ncbi:MAG: archease [Candidatus Aminicenantales bacterium]|jgi:SHS2 domain-containing protein
MAEMKKYEILPHTADGKFRAYGRTLEEAFMNAALATASLMWAWARIEPKLSRALRVRGRDREQLLVKFLGEIIYLFETERFLLGSVASLVIRADEKDWLLEAEFKGDIFSDRYEIYGGVKAVTYSDMKIEECDGFTLQVVVDM